MSEKKPPMEFVVETWAPEFGASVKSLDLEKALEPAKLEVDFPLKDWKAITPSLHAEPLTNLSFIDGVRRTDARLWIKEKDGLSSPSICATVAAGAVKVINNKAVCEHLNVRRYFLTASALGEDIETKYGDYFFHSLEDDSIEKSMSGVQRVMLDLEDEVSDLLDPEMPVVYDGPLRGRSSKYSVGMIKTHHKMYLEGKALEVLMQLKAGQITPIFKIEGREHRYVWYLQLPGLKAHPLGGIVRCEIPAKASIAQVKPFVYSISATLPRFASEPHKDTRAPQNLYPIAGLERELKRRLGDQRLLEKGLRMRSN